jgi:hypothetical protein
MQSLQSEVIIASDGGSPVVPGKSGVLLLLPVCPVYLLPMCPDCTYRGEVTSILEIPRGIGTDAGNSHEK